MSWWPLRGGSEGAEPRPIGESLEAATRRLGSPGVGTLGAIFARWEELVGPDVASHARPHRLRAGVLVVEVDQPAWATQLRYLSGNLLERVRQVTGADEVVEVQIRVRGPGGGGDRRRGRFRQPDSPLW